MNLRPADNELAQLAEFQRRHKVSLVCLVVTEVVGAAHLKEQLGDVQAVRLLEQHDQILRDVRRGFPGSLEVSSNGTQFLLVFEKPSDAVRFALELQNRISLLGRKVKQDLPEKIGIHAGEVLMEVPTDATRPPTLNGIHVDIVQALQSLAGPGQILLTRFAYDNARQVLKSLSDSGSGGLGWKVHGPYQIDGFADPIEVCAVGHSARDTFRAPTGNDHVHRLAPPALPELEVDDDTADSPWHRLLHPSPMLRRSAWKGAVLTAGVGMLACWSKWFDGPSYDLGYLFRPRVVPEEVVIVEMDEPSVKQLKQDNAAIWDRRLHAQMLSRLHAAGAKAVGFDLLFDLLTEPEADRELLAGLATNGPVVLGAAIGAGRLGVQVLAPHPLFRDAARWGLAEHGGSSKPIRRQTPSIEGYPTMAQLLVEVVTGPEPKVPTDRWLKYYGPPRTIPYSSFASVLSNEVPASAISNKVVFVGANLQITDMVNRGDKFPSPYSRWGHPLISGVEVNATSFLNLLRGDWLDRWPRGWELLLFAAAGLGLGYLLVHFEPGWAVIAGLVAAVGVGLTSMIQVWTTGVWFPWLVFSTVQAPAAILWAVTARTRLIRASYQKLRRSPQWPKTTPLSPEFAPGGTRKLDPSGPGDDGAPPPEIPNHRMIRRVGKGAYGEVWLASDVLGSFHAVKIVRRDRFADDAPFDREFKGLQRYTPISRSHPGLVNILHVGIDESGGFFFYIMEAGDDQRQGPFIDAKNYVPRNLGNDVTHRGAVPLEEVVQYGIEISEALAFLHRQGLIHRDLKPANIIFVKGRPKIADIGLVTEIGLDASHGGTPGFIPPEGPGLRSADVFSLGRLLYVALSGRPVKEFPNLPLSVTRAAPADRLKQLENVLLRACEPIDTERYQTAEELLAALKACRPAQSEPENDGTPTSVEGAMGQVGGTAERA